MTVRARTKTSNSKPSTGNPGPSEPAGPSPLAWTALGGLLIAGLLPACANVELFPYWDLDPTATWVPTTGITPAWMLALVVLSLLSSAAAILAEARRGRPIGWMQVALASVGSIGVLAHTVFDGPLHNGAVDGLEHAVKAAPWLALVWGAVGMSHLCRDARVRTVALAVLAGFAVPLVAKGALQVFVEHPATVAQFERTKASVFEANGWRPDSPAALAYERRLMQPEASGWFGLTNVYASLMAAIAGGLIAAAVSAARADRRVRRPTLIAIGVAACALAGLLLSKSKGGIGAMGLALAVCAGFAVLRRVRPNSSPLTARLLGPAAVLLVLAAIGVRGAIGTDLGEKSLLFRAFYAVGSLRIWGEFPLVGVGPDGFQDAYAAAKIPIATETVQSPHSVGFDWTATLGLFGLAWLAWLVWRSTRLFDGVRTAGEGPAELTTDETPPSRDMLRAAVLVIAAVGLASAFVERELATPLGAFVRVAGLAGWLGSAVLLMRFVRTAAGGWLAAGAGLALVAHAQLEVTPVWVNAAPLFGVWFGAATVDRSVRTTRSGIAPDTRRSRETSAGRLFRGPGLGLVPTALAVWVGAGVWVPVWRWESQLRLAAFLVRPGAELRTMLDEAKVSRDRAALERVAAEATALTGRGVPARAEALDRVIAAARLGLMEGAADALADATAYRPGHVPTVQARGRLLLQLGASHPDLDLAKGSVIFAVTEANSLPRLTPRSTAAWDWMGVVTERAVEIWEARTGSPAGSEDPIEWGDAALPWLALSSRTPYAVRPAVRLMDLHARMGEIDDAREWAAEAIRRDGLTGLDPIAGLTDAERARAEALVGE